MKETVILIDWSIHQSNTYIISLLEAIFLSYSDFLHSWQFLIHWIYILNLQRTYFQNRVWIKESHLFHVNEHFYSSCQLDVPVKLEFRYSHYFNICCHMCLWMASWCLANGVLHNWVIYCLHSQTFRRIMCIIKLINVCLLLTLLTVLSYFRLGKEKTHCRLIKASTYL